MNFINLWNRYKIFLDPEMPWKEYKETYKAFTSAMTSGNKKDRKPYINYLKHKETEVYLRHDKFVLIHDIINYKQIH